MEKPEKVFNAWPVQASVFVNERVVDGVGREIPSVSFQKRYKDGEQWKTTTVLDTNDLPKAELVLNQAYSYLVTRTKKTESLEEIL